MKIIYQHKLLPQFTAEKSDRGDYIIWETENGVKSSSGIAVQYLHPGEIHRYRTIVNELIENSNDWELQKDWIDKAYDKYYGDSELPDQHLLDKSQRKDFREAINEFLPKIP